ncbi:hypothetical protein BCR24_14845 [Enterococcus ureilyticus]|uniref:Uncharacterized protein n=1 Tax=Enterococcus ureilyticus TaxID=1131292 RepID=A0A1E5HCK9_9ENTE|nr:hypothetical protein [Enterococcus ureilyticus]MBM7690352.1 hypothetical protein [Enterococcus ureilyticus]OEG22555.1 hypothetical protein BCR24_14845 [Enterococcus ureilyticus]
MASSAYCLQQLTFYKEKRDDLKLKQTKLKGLKLEAKHVVERDSSGMDGFAYVERKDTEKKHIKSCVNKVNKERKSALSKIAEKLGEYDDEIIDWGHKYTSALTQERFAAEQKRKADKEAADKVKNK